MPRNIIVCCDGTNNEFGPENTNVVRLVEILERDAQLVYYDPGVGTLPEPGIWSKIGGMISQIGGLAFGAGLPWKVEEAYTYLMNYWERGDRVFLFGFSRGAYSARVLAGMLHAIGVLPRGSENMVPYAMRLFKAIRGGATTLPAVSECTRAGTGCGSCRGRLAGLLLQHAPARNGSH